MKILVIGSGGREHAIIDKLSQSPRVDKLFCIPGNPGIAETAKCVNIDISDNEALYEFAVSNQIDLTVVGPEGPLANGMVDFFSERGMKIFGPSQKAALIEGSKAFAKELMDKYGIPTAHYKICSTPEEAKAYIYEKKAPIVVKADGLAAGKGVVVAFTIEEAIQAIDNIMCDQVFGNAGCRVVLEEYLEGEEASVLAFTDGTTIVSMPAAQDHKRVYDHDCGPNTGGMGAYAPAPVVTDIISIEVMKKILQPAIDAMVKEGRPYKGCLYAGIILTACGPKVIEFNARFGDPETQVVLPLLESDLVDIMLGCIDGQLGNLKINWKNKCAVCVVLASGGYPGSYETGKVITGLNTSDNHIRIYHAGTSSDGNNYFTAGGRVLGITAIGETIEQSVNNVYSTINKIDFEGMHYRKDIAYRALKKGVKL